MKVNKKELLNVLETLKPGLNSGNTTVELSDCFVMEEETITTFNDQMACKVPFDLGFIGGVKADEFYKTISKMGPKKGTLDISISGESGEAQEVIISGARAKAGIIIQPPLDRIEDIWSTVRMYKLPLDFTQAIKSASFCISNNQSTPILTCLNVTGGYVYSTDRRRVFRQKMELPVKATFVLPAQFVPHLSKYPLEKIGVKNGWAQFSIKGSELMISCRVYASDDFPDIVSFFDTEMKEITEINSPKNEALKSALTKASVFCEGEFEMDKTVTVKVTKKFWEISSQTPTLGWYKEKVPAKNKTTFEFVIGLNFLLQIADNFKGGTLKELPGNGKERAYVLEFNGDNWDHLVMLASVDFGM